MTSPSLSLKLAARASGTRSINASRICWKDMAGLQGWVGTIMPASAPPGL
jgi:hypothetical protein